jgi:mannose-6-phosphate isomerase
VLELGERYPGDAGVLAALLLNLLSLQPGEAIYLPAGNLHTYLQGVAVEVMANSDNVLRGGLTPKRVDAPELLQVLDFTPTTEAALRPEITRDGMELIYHTPALEFAVPVLCIDGGSATRSPRPPAITDRRSCCARKARRCAPSPAR